MKNIIKFKVAPRPPPPLYANEEERNKRNFYRSPQSAEYVIALLNRWDEGGRKDILLNPLKMDMTPCTFRQMLYAGVHYIKFTLEKGDKRTRALDLYSHAIIRVLGHHLKLCKSNRIKNLDIDSAIVSADEFELENPVASLIEWLQNSHEIEEMITHSGILDVNQVSQVRNLMSQPENARSFLVDVSYKGYKIIRYDI